MTLQVGDTVKIINAKGIECNEGFFKDGDVTTITSYRGYLSLAHSSPELDGSLVILSEEYHCVEKI